MNLGEWDRARVVVFSRAAKVSATPAVQKILEMAIESATSDGFSADILFFSMHKDRNSLFTDWSHVDPQALQNCFRQRMARKYHPGSSSSILESGNAQTLRALFTWTSLGNDAQREVTDFLKFEMQRKPELLGKLISWFYGKEMMVGQETLPNLGKLLPLAEIDQMLTKYDEKAFRSTQESESIERFKAARIAAQTQQHPVMVNPNDVQKANS